MKTPSKHKSSWWWKWEFCFDRQAHQSSEAHCYLCDMALLFAWATTWESTQGFLLSLLHCKTLPIVNCWSAGYSSHPTALLRRGRSGNEGDDGVWITSPIDLVISSRTIHRIVISVYLAHYTFQLPVLFRLQIHGCIFWNPNWYSEWFRTWCLKPYPRKEKSCA